MSLLCFHLLLQVKYSVSFARDRDSEFFSVWRKLDAWLQKKNYDRVQDVNPVEKTTTQRLQTNGQIWPLNFQDCQMLKLKKKSKFYVEKLWNKPYLAKVPRKRYHLNGNIIGFSTQAEKLELLTEWIAPRESTTKEVPFEWSQHRISFRDSKTRSSSALYIFRVACERERV